MSDKTINLGLKQNWQQFSLLVLINAFVGGMVGLERAVLPLIAEEEFGLASRLAVLSFIASFGWVKAIANLLAGRLSDKWGRKKVLLLGWLFGLPVPFLIIWAPSWSWIIFANVLLGVNQGLCWSTTVIMKIDLVGVRQRGLAMGLNEAAGYLAVSAAAFASGYIAARYGLRPYPFYLGVAFAFCGLLISWALVRETREHALYESALSRGQGRPDGAEDKKRLSGSKVSETFWHIFLYTSWKNRTLFSTSQAGLVNNLNDGVAWGLFPLYFASAGLSVKEIGILAAVYPALWGLGQMLTGALSDRTGRKPLIVAGMLLQGLGILGIVFQKEYAWWIVDMSLMGIGTAMVYPTLIAAVSDVVDAKWRASAIGVYRLWRDMGYVVGALAAGWIADQLGMDKAIGTIGMITVLSGGIVAMFMRETLPDEH